MRAGYTHEGSVQKPSDGMNLQKLMCLTWKMMSLFSETPTWIRSRDHLLIWILRLGIHQSKINSCGVIKQSLDSNKLCVRKTMTKMTLSICTTQRNKITIERNLPRNLNRNSKIRNCTQLRSGKSNTVAPLSFPRITCRSNRQRIQLFLLEQALWILSLNSWPRQSTTQVKTFFKARQMEDQFQSSSKSEATQSEMEVVAPSLPLKMP